MRKRYLCRLIASAVAVVACLAPGAAYADCAGGWCTGVKINYVFTSGSVDGWISTTGTEAGLSCTPESSKLIRVSATSSNAQQLYAMILTAYTSGQTVDVRTTETGTCTVGYITMGVP